jgi:hypothetical protein
MKKRDESGGGGGGSVCSKKRNTYESEYSIFLNTLQTLVGAKNTLRKMLEV